VLDAQMAAIHAGSKRSCGRPRMVQGLRDQSVLASRRIVGWPMNERITAELVCQALRSAY